MHTADYPTAESLNEIDWQAINRTLPSLARSYIYAFSIPAWQGQEEEIAKDIAQEGLRKLIEQLRKAERGEAPPILALQPLLKVIIRNCCLDLRRRDRHQAGAFSDEQLQALPSRYHNRTNPIEEATERLYREELFKQLAFEIARFPRKQKQAILLDIAKRMHFDQQDNTLLVAFLAAGIDLRIYRRRLASNSRTRLQHSANLTVAYKRIARLSSLRRYTSVG